MIKSYTDLEQSKKLAEILPFESADMYFYDKDAFTGALSAFNGGVLIRDSNNEFPNKTIPCWSLAALYGILPNSKNESTTLSRGGWKIAPVEYIDKWFCEYEEEVDEDNPYRSFTVSADNPIDACYEVIIKLYELKML